MMDMARDFKVTNFVFASSSSVYGDNTKVPFAETDRVDSPVRSPPPRHVIAAALRPVHAKLTVTPLHR
jgi:nucleoside-diphosphate-sugar epimerase